MRRWLACTIAGLLHAAAHAGEPILVPDFTPGTTHEVGIASLLQQWVAEVLDETGHIALSSEVVRPVVGDTSLCADTASCPREALQQLPARIAVVVRVRRSGDELLAEVGLYEQSSDTAVEVRELVIEPGQEAELARAIGRLVDDLVSVSGPSPTSDVIAAAKLVEAEPVDESVADVPVAEPVADVPPKKTAWLAGVRGRPQRAGMTGAEFARKRTPHGGRVIVELRVGAGLGDTGRAADVWVTLAATGSEPWYQEGPLQGTGVRAEAFVGYAPSAWFDVGAVVGMQGGRKELTSGWQDELGNSDSGSDGTSTLYLHLQARARLYMVPSGPFKPFVVAGGELKTFGRLSISGNEGIGYPEPKGGVIPGVLVGGGAVIDVHPNVGLVLEGDAVIHLGNRAGWAEYQAQYRPAGAPSPPDIAGYTLGFTGGVQLRF